MFSSEEPLRSPGEKRAGLSAPCLVRMSPVSLFWIIKHISTCEPFKSTGKRGIPWPWRDLMKVGIPPSGGSKANMKGLFCKPQACGRKHCPEQRGRFCPGAPSAASFSPQHSPSWVACRLPCVLLRLPAMPQWAAVAMISARLPGGRLERRHPVGSLLCLVGPSPEKLLIFPPITRVPISADPHQHLPWSVL